MPFLHGGGSVPLLGRRAGQMAGGGGGGGGGAGPNTALMSVTGGSSVTTLASGGYKWGQMFTTQQALTVTGAWIFLPAPSDPVAIQLYRISTTAGFMTEVILQPAEVQAGVGRFVAFDTPQELGAGLTYATTCWSAGAWARYDTATGLTVDPRIANNRGIYHGYGGTQYQIPTSNNATDRGFIFPAVTD